MVGAGPEIFDFLPVLLLDLRPVLNSLPECSGTGLGELIDFAESLGNFLIDSFRPVELKSFQSSK